MLKARKRFGQNFLVDRGVVQRIVRAIGIRTGDRLLEIGPGRGALTELLVNTGNPLTLVEIDRDLAAELTDRFPETALVNQDVMTVRIEDLAAAGPIRVIGNLPYNISTPLLFKLLDAHEHIHDMHFMLQREVVDRMTASPSTRSYGRLSVMTQLMCEAEKLFEVPPEAFSPRPKVHSAIVRLIPAPRISDEDRSLLAQMLIQAFSARRKTIRNALANFLSPAEIETLGLDPSLRPENLSVDDYLACTRFIKARVKTAGTSSNQPDS